MTSTATRAKTTPTSAVVVPSLNNDDLLALLGQSGNLPQQSTQFHRLSLQGGLLTASDGEVFPPKKDGPAVIVRIVKPPVYYNAFFLSDKPDNGSIDAATIGRPDLNGSFVRRYDDQAEQALDTNPANAVYDQLVELTGNRGQFKADMQVQIVPPSGQLTGEEPIYTLTLSTTSVFEWRGSSKDPIRGSVSDENFIIKLSKMAAEEAKANGADEDAQRKAVLDAMTSLRLGGVAAGIYPVQANNNGRVWTVLRFDPVYIDSITEAPALPSGNDAGNDVPF